MSRPGHAASEFIGRIEKAEKRIQRIAVRRGSLGLLSTDITMPQLRVLAILATSGSQTSHGLAEALGIGPTALTGIVDRLEARGYVERLPDPHDRRVRKVGLTDAGTRHMIELNEIKRSHSQRVFARMKAADLRKLAEGIEALAAAFEAEFAD